MWFNVQRSITCCRFQCCLISQETHFWAFKSEPQIDNRSLRVNNRHNIAYCGTHPASTQNCNRTYRNEGSVSQRLILNFLLVYKLCYPVMEGMAVTNNDAMIAWVLHLSRATGITKAELQELCSVMGGTGTGIQASIKKRKKIKSWSSPEPIIRKVIGEYMNPFRKKKTAEYRIFSSFTNSPATRIYVLIMVKSPDRWSRHLRL